MVKAAQVQYWYRFFCRSGSRCSGTAGFDQKMGSAQCYPGSEVYGNRPSLDPICTVEL